MVPLPLTESIPYDRPPESLLTHTAKHFDPHGQNLEGGTRETTFLGATRASRLTRSTPWPTRAITFRPTRATTFFLAHTGSNFSAHAGNNLSAHTGNNFLAPTGKTLLRAKPFGPRGHKSPAYVIEKDTKRISGFYSRPVENRLDVILNRLESNFRTTHAHVGNNISKLITFHPSSWGPFDMKNYEYIYTC